MYAGAQFACVISTGGYTRSAKELASSTDVMLLDAFEISKFSELLGFQSLSGLADDEPELPTISFAFHIDSEGVVGSILRSVLKNAPLDELEIQASTLAEVFTSIDADTGLGSFECTPTEAALLIGMIETALNGNMPVNDTNLEAVRASELCDSPIILTLSHGDIVGISDLYSSERIAEIERFIDFMALKLPEPWKAVCVSLIEKERSKRSAL